jgi:diguanylate cyclase (GGDEF)-like protein
MTANFSIEGTPLHVTTSIGIAYTDGVNLGAEQLMAHADQALYQAKAKGRNTFVLTDIREPAMNAFLAAWKADTKPQES